ncbi:siderophore-interacting protein [Tistrella mobilis]|uniref:FAD-binding 9 siderophore-interacting domain protein n=1 Tax=Tistrella mobilis (strain KA081020-065) TaxID=1110502 RepID=I3TTX7_TISMK|nr:FAD-binding protein [Tistrella mobilis]AFK56215.1 FAD-binding 9 siderophore-interacting domain protein [Tistrella mobilis KA081020-065]
MTSTFEPRTDAVPQPGRIARTLQSWFMRPARVAAVETLSPHFRLITLEGTALKDVAWTIGQKLQVAMGTGMTARTYTPIFWDAAAGRTQLLAYLHDQDAASGAAPGSRWAAALTAGAGCHVFGPRRSLDLTGAGGPVVVFGDETSFALAASLGAEGDAEGHLFEVTDVAASRLVLARMGLNGARVIGRQAGDTHLAVAEAELTRLAARRVRFALTGKASSIQRMSRALKTIGVPAARIRAKAYWAPGKTGLD